jgi:hypothetical protein
MDNEQITKTLRTMSKFIVGLESEILGLRAAVTVLQVTVATLAEEEPTAFVAQLRDAERNTLQSLPASQRLQELSALMDFLEKHGDSLGQHKA